MIHSMTAFSRIQKQFDVGDFCWEIRSVNHRYLDVSFRLPESFRFLEAELESLLRDKIHRGKLECHLKYKDTSCDNRSMLINIGTINALLDLSGKLSASHHLANDMTVSQVLSWPGVVEANPLDMEELSQIALELFQKSIDKLCEVRAGEGRSLKAYVEDRLQALRQEVMKSKSIMVSMSAKTKDKLLTRLHELQMDVTEARVEQEIALLLAKLDVSEELDRLETHIAEVNRTLNAEKVTGRRLDFLMQELNREANTLSSKSDSAELTLCAVEMKVLIEQMREQIQNFE